MNDGMRKVIGICADCQHLFGKIITGNDDEELCSFKCLVSGDSLEEKVERCSHNQNNNDVSLFRSEQYRNE